MDGFSDDLSDIEFVMDDDSVLDAQERSFAENAYADGVAYEARNILDMF